jgi:hypothetical protein
LWRFDIKVTIANPELVLAYTDEPTNQERFGRAEHGRIYRRRVKELEALQHLEDIHKLLPGCGFDSTEPEVFGVPLWDGARLLLRLAGSPSSTQLDDAVEIIAIRESNV